MTAIHDEGKLAKEGNPRLGGSRSKSGNKHIY